MTFEDGHTVTGVHHDVRRVYRSEWDRPGRQIHGGHVEGLKLASCTLGKTWVREENGMLIKNV